MSRGGPRPGSGRKSLYFYIVGDKRYDSLKTAADAEGVSTKTIHNWCSDGKKSKDNCWKEPKKAQKKYDKPDVNVEKEAEKAKMTPIEYLENIMLNENEDKDRRDKVAYWLLPYLHPKADKKQGKKPERQERAKKAGSGKFAPSRAPHLKAIK